MDEGDSTQCGYSARSPSGRRCWRWCSAPARRVGGSASRNDQDRLRRVRRGPRHGRGLCPGPGGRGLHCRPGRHRRLVPVGLTAAAIESGQIDLKPEYLGGGLGVLRRHADADSEENKADLQAALAGKGGGITVLDYTPGQDTNAFVVRQDTASQLNLAKMSDVARGPERAQVGARHGLPDQPAVRAVPEGRLRHRVRPTSRSWRRATRRWPRRCSTRPSTWRSCAPPARRSQFNGWVVLEDDKETQPAENIAPIVRNDFLAKVDQGEVHEDPQRRVRQDRHGDARPALLRRHDHPQGPERRRVRVAEVGGARRLLAAPRLRPEPPAPPGARQFHVGSGLDPGPDPDAAICNANGLHSTYLQRGWLDAPARLGSTGLDLLATRRSPRVSPRRSFNA